MAAPRAGTEEVLEGDNTLRFPHALLISASAGSGKTYTLTRRYVQLLLSDKAPENGLQNILAVTFTRNAAKEMRVRILEWLAKTALDPASPEFSATRPLLSVPRGALAGRAAQTMERILDNYGDFHVQTIDKFMARVMRGSADQLGVRPDQEISTSYAALVDEALYFMLTRLDTEITRAELDAFLASLPPGGSFRWNPVPEIKENLSRFLAQEGKLKGELAPLGGKAAADLEKIFLQTLDLAKKLAEALPGKVDEETLEIIARPVTAAGLREHVEAYRGRLKTHGILRGVNVKSLDKLGEKALTLKAQLESSQGELELLLAGLYYEPYLVFYRKFREKLALIERSRAETIHIQEVSKRLSGYISADSVPEIYLKLGETISHYLIDEFQDTDVIQWGNFRLLIEEALARGGSLFLVGDLKQAIYMFRNADYKIMKDLLDNAGGTPRCLDLSPLERGLELRNLPVNYRSDGAVLGYVDDLFKRRLKESPDALPDGDVTGLTSYEQGVKPGREAAGYALEEVLRYGDRAERDALVKARLLELFTGKGGLLERFSPGDILVLVQKNKQVTPVVEWLTAAKITVASSATLDIRNRKLVGELVALLKFLDSPIDDLAFAEVITGGAFLEEAKRAGLEFTAENARALMLGRAGDYGHLYAAFRAAYPELWEKYFERLYASAGYLPVYELVSLAMRGLRVFDNFPGEAAFLVKFLDAANAMQNEGANSVKDFLERALGEDDAEGAAHFSIVLPDYLDAVRVMTYHASKGLGSPVVVNLIYDDKEPNADMFIAPEGGHSRVYHITKGAAAASPKLARIREEKSVDDRLQALNLLYVINTRAERELYNFVTVKKKAEKKDEA
jgi:ATP-dependent exoDNAse (exonuclease V) beta subunit